MEIGKRIQELREKFDMNQKELADKVGLNYSVMNRIESGKRPIRDDELIKIADVFNVTTDYLLGRTDDPNGEEDIVTIAAHHDGEEFSDEEKEMIEKFKDMVREMKKKKRS